MLTNRGRRDSIPSIGAVGFAVLLLAPSRTLTAQARSRIPRASKPAQRSWSGRLNQSTCSRSTAASILQSSIGTSWNRPRAAW